MSATSARGWWMTTTQVTKSLLQMVRKAEMQTSASVADRPEVGSSQKSREAWAATPRAKLTRRLWPPEIPRTSSPPIMLSWTSCKPKVSSKMPTQLSGFLCPSVGGCFNLALNNTASRTFQCAGIMSSWPTYAAMRRNRRCFRGRPFTQTSPSYLAVFFSASMSRSVVLPLPLGPISAMSSPGAKCPETGSKMVLGTLFPWASFVSIEKVRARKVKLTGGSANAEGLMPSDVTPGCVIR
mmetsp:Transcript_120573/g.346404  ORF Transcript_120573/g.346404 Transcript_120573/m.346404 type:complete len:239 (+) Transcript_120573:1241-1957(+)